MSAPLVVNTTDGTVWVLHTVTRSELALYAVAGACNCPSYLLATLAELAEHGIAGSADALPMPAGPVVRSELDQAHDDVVGACLARWEEEQENARLRLALASAKRGRSRLRARVAELLAERRETNEALDDAVQALRADGITRRIAPTQALAEDVTPQVLKLRNLPAGQRAALEDPHDGPLHHRYALGHDMPELGGGR
ncbi:hypothetical protein [Streptomyces mirabilis]|uniref:hypothetical protein n=1 Tax=Streptomyces mirabilis TaxID=68239 RepID=UPI0033CA05E1